MGTRGLRRAERVLPGIKQGRAAKVSTETKDQVRRMWQTKWGPKPAP